MINVRFEYGTDAQNLIEFPKYPERNTKPIIDVKKNLRISQHNEDYIRMKGRINRHEEFQWKNLTRAQYEELLSLCNSSVSRYFKVTEIDTSTNPFTETPEIFGFYYFICDADPTRVAVGAFKYDSLKIQFRKKR